MMYIKYKDEILELLELRDGIESKAAGLAAERATESQIAELREAYMQLEEAALSKKNTTKKDVNFHMVLIKISGNKLFRRVYVSLVDLLKDTIDKIRLEALTKPEGPIIELKRHEKILNAIEQKDKEKAKEVMSENMEQVLK
ncbi:MAG: FCD domain-containing protein [Desulfitobacteriaceae bacterium]|nr:FCD domain-containing protein [Desulfitobacteriaceae bacterium]MDD4347037.1 FCD domain-containing protein [Desulfitobacteriaceae bacterium]MDD4402778.1 FCD domain-containing protein [Desulfitobacteriaceae bacterium]